LTTGALMCGNAAQGRGRLARIGQASRLFDGGHDPPAVEPHVEPIGPHAGLLEQSYH
jgi:hypothetical protein